MEYVLQRIKAEPDARDIANLVALVDLIRPSHPTQSEQAASNLLTLCYLLELQPALRATLRRYLITIMATRKEAHLYADTGILGSQNIFTAATQRLGWKILPPAINDDYLKDVFGQIFHRRSDYLWVEGVTDDTWLRLIDALHLEDLDDSASLHHLVSELLEAMLVLSHRLTAMGLEPELVRNHREIEEFESPFLAQNREITTFVSQYREVMAGTRTDHDDEKHILVLLDQCLQVLNRIRKNAGRNGVSVSATYLVVRLGQTIGRLETLLRLLQTDPGERRLVTINFLRELVNADNHKLSLRELFATNTEMLALQITEHAGRTGEHYVTTSRRGYFRMLRSAMGAGFFVGFMAMFKILAAKLKLAPFGEAFVFSMNYSFGFMLIHVLHFTIATKQPAMTAANIAATIHQTINEPNQGNTGRKNNANLDELADLTVNVFRTQFIAILGNVLIVLPVAFAIAWAIYFQSGHHLVNVAKAAKLLHDLDPIHSLAIPHAAIAGVCLFLAGLISGYYDNMAIYNRIPERLRQLRWLNRLLGEARTLRMTQYIENNLGALAGNFYFGIMLGSIGTLGFILGLPIDIRHITFSSANFAFALAANGNELPWETTVLSLIGIAAIGLTNLLVSFSLALMVALQSRRVRYRQWLPLAGLILRRLLKRPASFFWPPRNTEPVLEHTPTTSTNSKPDADTLNNHSA